jgi:hypothetical protein
VFVYLSGPMTAKEGYLVEENVTAGLRAYLACLRAGVPAFSPHIGGAFPSAWAEIPWETWLAYDYAVIDRCTHVVMLPRWESSRGAIAERAYAIQQQIPVVDSLDEFLASCLAGQAPATP